MMQCGLFVTAGTYRANVTHGVFTHFIREEDAGMTSGRLDDGRARTRGPARLCRVVGSGAVRVVTALR